MSSLICSSTVVRVSSVLNRDIKQFGKSFMFDQREETCWNSDQGSPQSVTLEFPNPVCPSELKIKFQGGFCGKECYLQTDVEGAGWKEIMQFSPQDTSSLQAFPISSSPEGIKRLRVVFDSSTDFYGRIIIYLLDITGKVLLSQPDVS